MAVHAANRALTQCFGLLYSLFDSSQLGSTGKLTRPFLLSCQLLSISVYLSICNPQRVHGHFDGSSVRQL
jgi:hypothetical protein